MKSGLAMSFPAPWWPPTQPAQEQKAPPLHSRATTDNIQASSATLHPHETRPSEARRLEAMVLQPRVIIIWAILVVVALGGSRTLSFSEYAKIMVHKKRRKKTQYPSMAMVKEQTLRFYSQPPKKYSKMALTVHHR